MMSHYFSRMNVPMKRQSPHSFTTWPPRCCYRTRSLMRRLATFCTRNAAKMMSISIHHRCVCGMKMIWWPISGIQLKKWNSIRGVGSEASGPAKGAAEIINIMSEYQQTWTWAKMRLVNRKSSFEHHSDLGEVANNCVYPISKESLEFVVFYTHWELVHRNVQLIWKRRRHMVHTI